MVTIENWKISHSGWVFKNNISKPTKNETKKTKPQTSIKRETQRECETEKKTNKNERKMSWQTYVDDHLMCDIDATGHFLSSAAIVGHDGSIWAQSANFPQVFIISDLFIAVLDLCSCFWEFESLNECFVWLNRLIDFLFFCGYAIVVFGHFGWIFKNYHAYN